MLRKTPGACYLEASIPSSLGREIESVRKLYPKLSDSAFFIAVLVEGLNRLSSSYELGGDE